MAKGTLKIRVVGDASHLQKTLGKATGNLAKFAKVGVLGAAAAVAGGVAISIKSFADFDAAMTESTAIMGDVSNAMRKDMSDAAREVAKTTKFSATEAAQSYFFLASAGMDAAQSIEALPKVAAFAQAGAFDMARATDLLTDAQSALGLVVDDSAKSLENLARVGDVLVGANTLANASVEQFSESLTQKAGAALRVLNKDIEEGVAVLAVYADQGTKGSEAGVQLNAVLEGLTRTARLKADAYKDLGVAVFDSSGEMRNMGDIVGDLEKSLAGMSTEQQFAELASLGLTRQARDGTVALLGNADAIREYEAKLRDMGGVTQDVADKQMDTFWAKLGIVKDQLLDVALSVGQTLMPALEGFADWLTAKLPAVTGFFDRISSKFTDLLGSAEESSAGSIVAMDSFTAMAQRRSGEVVSSLGGIETALDSFEQQARRKLAEAGGTITIFREDADEEFSEMDGFMKRLGEAWATVWDEDIVPWFHDTLIPWLVDEAAPAIGAAGIKIGGALGRGIVDGLNDALTSWGVPDVWADFIAPTDGPRSLFKTGGGGSSPNPAAGGAPKPFVPMAEGGIVRARPGGTLALIAEAGRDEPVVPLDGRHSLGGTIIKIDVHGTVVTERELVDLIDRAQARANARNGR